MKDPVAVEFLACRRSDSGSFLLAYGENAFFTVWVVRDAPSAPYSDAITGTTPGAPVLGAEVGDGSEPVFEATTVVEGVANVARLPESLECPSDELCDVITKVPTGVAVEC